jgi:hypothetical protein
VTPVAYQPFFAASMGTAAALLGLLFVAVAVAPERTVGAGAPVERQMVAESVFTALLNAFFLSMSGTIPDINIGSVALVLSGFALFQTLQVGRRLWPRQLTVRSAVQRLSLVVVALAIYGGQLENAFQLVQVVGPGAPIGGQINILFALYAFALGRSWELLGARRGFFVRRLSPTFSSDGEPSASGASHPKPSPPSEEPDGAAKAVIPSD